MLDFRLVSQQRNQLKINAKRREEKANKLDIACLCAILYKAINA